LYNPIELMKDYGQDQAFRVYMGTRLAAKPVGRGYSDGPIKCPKDFFSRALFLRAPKNGEGPAVVR